MSKNKTKKLTSVKVCTIIYIKSKHKFLETDEPQMTFQRLVNRCLYLWSSNIEAFDNLIYSVNDDVWDYSLSGSTEI